jgi:hypothetical protein
MEGKVIIKAIQSRYATYHPVKIKNIKETSILTEEKREYPEVDEELKEKLKSLGYIQ